jgi:peptidoglycan/xylan/chitin deacetylase (PgdA/CDA1 family)
MDGMLSGWLPRIPVVLMYHSVSPYQLDPYRVTVRPERFARQMHWLCRSGLTGVSVRHLLTMRRNGSGRGLIGLTFDDGYADFATYAVPILQCWGFTATVFPAAGRLGEDNDWDSAGPRKALLTTERLQQVAAAGMEIGSHGMRHVSLVAAPDADLAEEVVHSRQVLREVSGQEVAGFCYPWGHVDQRVVDQVRAAGYSYGCAVTRSPLTSSYALPRHYIGDADSWPRLWAKAVCHCLGWDYNRPSPVVGQARPERSDVNAAFGLTALCPAPAARVGPGPDRPGAGRAPDRRVALGD